MADQPDGLARFTADKGQFDVLFEASGNERALRGAFRFHEEFAMAVAHLNKALVDVKPLISATLSYRDSARAFTLAVDRSQAMKVLLNFE